MTVIDKTWIEIGRLDDIPVRGARVVKTPAGCLAVFRADDDSVYALEDRCPHRGGPLSNGIVHHKSVTCPLHNWVISLETGEAQGADAGRVETYRLRVEDRRIFVDATMLAHRREA